MVEGDCDCDSDCVVFFFDVGAVLDGEFFFICFVIIGISGLTGDTSDIFCGEVVGASKIV